MDNKIIKNEYIYFVEEIKEKIRLTQYETLKIVNTSLINLYWNIGKEIYIKQQKNGWGKAIVEELAKELKKEFPKVKGFSARNLWNMRNFYIEYKSNEFLQPMAAEISWTKNIIIMEKCKDSL